jgi:hypothetical protein
MQITVVDFIGKIPKSKFPKPRTEFLTRSKRMMSIIDADHSDGLAWSSRIAHKIGQVSRTSADFFAPRHAA